MAREFQDAMYLGYFLRIFRENVTISTPGGILLANLRSVPAARQFCREQRKLDALEVREVSCSGESARSPVPPLASLTSSAAISTATRSPDDEARRPPGIESPRSTLRQGGAA